MRAFRLINKWMYDDYTEESDFIGSWLKVEEDLKVLMKIWWNVCSLGNTYPLQDFNKF